MRNPQQVLERELLELLGRGRAERIAARYHGFDGGGGETLQSVGNAFGITRERVRQIVTAASARLRSRRWFSPVLDTTIAFVADQISAAAGVIDAGVIEAEMRSEGLTAGLFRIETIRFADRHHGPETGRTSRFDLRNCATVGYRGRFSQKTRG